jgi:hypothetical protein
MTAEREALDKALKQMECLQENLHKGMSKSIQRMQGFALMETVAEIRAAMRAADQQPAAHYPVEWGPSDARQLTCACGNPDPAHADQQTAAHHCNRAAHHAYGYHACPDCNPTVMPTDQQSALPVEKCGCSLEVKNECSRGRWNHPAGCEIWGSATDPKTVAECSGKCFHVGGEFIAEDPACPKHGNADNPE